MKTHHTASERKSTIRVTSEMEVQLAAGATRLVGGGPLVLVGVKPGEELASDPKLRTALYVDAVEKAPGVSGAQLALAVYTACRRARVDERPALLLKRGLLPDETLSLMRAEPLPGSDLIAARTDVALMGLARRFEEELSVAPELYVDEVLTTVLQHVRRAFERGFFAAVGQGKVARQQYVYVMSQQHSYVKYTTRILGYCVAYSQESNLRKHFAKHLSEEINHEKIIESDLAHLGADVAYVVDDLEPNVSTLQFTLGELALVSHFHDAILLTTAPLAAEGLTAHLDREFITDLNALVASWGVAEPEKATRFLASHIDFDSGYDGHFEGSMRILAPYLGTERKLRRYVAALHAQMNSFLRIYEDAMDESVLWT